jgi:hypothetical protein
MDLNQLVKKALVENNAEQYTALIPTLVKKITPILEVKARKLITPRLIKTVFASQLGSRKIKDNPEQLKLEGVE